MKAKKTLLVLISSVLMSCVLFAGDYEIFETRDYRIGLELVAEGLHHPWALAFLPDGTILITERRGRLLALSEGELSLVHQFSALAAGGQGGLLDIALHPDFKDNNLIFVSHSVSSPSGPTTAVTRARFVQNGLRDVERIFTARAGGRGMVHFGSRLLFGTDGYLYLTIGDRGQPNRAQNLDDHAGTLLRLDVDGNPAMANPRISPGSDPYIFSYGHRNAQGLVLDSVSNSILLHEHGPRGGDELNLIVAGANYGWPLVTHGINYDGSIISTQTSAPGMTDPLLEWTPSIAPSGMAVYTGDLFPAWQGDIFIGALAGMHIRRVIRSGQEIREQEMLLHREVGRVRDIRQGPDGALWFVSDAANGRLYRIIPAP